MISDRPNPLAYFLLKPFAPFMPVILAQAGIHATHQFKHDM